MRSGVESTLRSFEIRNFRLFFGGQLVSQVGNWLTLIAQTLFVLHLTDNNGVAVGVLTACQFLPVLVLGAWAGLVADRSDKRKLLLYVQVFAMMQSFAMAALAFTGHPPLLAIYAVAMAGGSPPPSTIRRDGRSWSRWCRRRTCRTRSASTRA